MTAKRISPKKSNTKLSKPKSFDIRIPALFAVIIILIGLIYIFSARAGASPWEFEAWPVPSNGVLIKADDKASTGQYVELSNITGKKLVDTQTSTAAINKATNLQQLQVALNTFSTQYGFEIRLTNSQVPVSQKYIVGLNLTTESQLADIKQYSALFINEVAKYPQDFVKSTNLKYVDLVNNIKIYGIDIGGTVFPDDNQMLLTVVDVSDTKFHHEFSHFFEYKFNSRYDRQEPAWLAQNPTGFSYSGTGYDAIRDNLIEVGDHPLDGIVSGYAKAALTEDRAEVWQNIMSSHLSNRLKFWSLTDTKLRAKVDLYKQYIQSKSSTMNSAYYDQINP